MLASISRFMPGMRFNVQFTFNRYPMRTMHRAVEMAEAQPRIVKVSLLRH